MADAIACAYALTLARENCLQVVSAPPLSEDCIIHSGSFTMSHPNIPAWVPSAIAMGMIALLIKLVLTVALSITSSWCELSAFFAMSKLDMQK